VWAARGGGWRAVRYRHAVYDKGTAALAVLAQDYARVIRTRASPHEKAPFLVSAVNMSHRSVSVCPDFFFCDHRARFLRISSMAVIYSIIMPSEQQQHGSCDSGRYVLIASHLTRYLIAQRCLHYAGTRAAQASFQPCTIKRLPPCSMMSVLKNRGRMMTGSEWRNERNRRSLERLERALPETFPKPVLVHALGRALIPPLPRLAIDSYWRAHPIRADRLARALAAKTGAPSGWAWTVSGSREHRPNTTFRTPPAPYREAAFKLGPGRCCVCGQPVYRFGWHIDLWRRGPNQNIEWHAACVAAWRLWTAPRTHLQFLKRLQLRRCAESGKRLVSRAEVDHRIPLHRVWYERRGDEWPSLLTFWGVPNLQVINRDAHAAKCLAEAQARLGLGIYKCEYHAAQVGRAAHHPA
jgi:hypothetical protein